MQRQAQLGLTIASALSLGLACASCLVTNEIDFEPNRSLPNVTLVSPPSPSAVSVTPSPDCPGQNQISFVAKYYYEDVEAQLAVLPVVNDQTLFTTYADPDPNGSPDHLAPQICIPQGSLTSPCNRVELFVSADRRRLSTNDVTQLRADPRIVSRAWLLVPSARDTGPSSAQPYRSFSDCLPPDGGT